MTGALPNSSEEKIFNTVYRTLEGTALGFAIPYVFQGLKFAKNTIPKYMTPQTTIATGSAASVGAVVDNATATENTPKNDIKQTDNITGNMLLTILNNLIILLLIKICRI